MLTMHFLDNPLWSSHLPLNAPLLPSSTPPFSKLLLFLPCCAPRFTRIVHLQVRDIVPKVAFFRLFVFPMFDCTCTVLSDEIIQVFCLSSLLYHRCQVRYPTDVHIFGHQSISFPCFLASSNRFKKNPCVMYCDVLFDAKRRGPACIHAEPLQVGGH